MKFFHVYNERSFEGLVKNGFLNEDSGFKIQHAFCVPDELRFNRFAAKGTRLHSMLKEGNYPFYVDRIAGGVTYYKYDFDRSLIEEYNDMLGDWFLGFQLHESASNRFGDWALILERMNGSKGPYDLETLRERSWSKTAVMRDGTVLQNFSHGTPEFYSRMTFPETHTNFHREIEEMFKMRLNETDGHILPCDSYYQYTNMQNKLGMNTFMPEIGWQIPSTRVQLALARGTAKAYGKTWGAYYETWNQQADGQYTMPCYNSCEENEWYLTQDTHPDDFTTYGHNGGSSRLLQKRLYYHALMSGADYFAEEWGLNCSYTDMNTFELSPYGIAKKDFIEHARTLRGIKLVTPFAIVLPSYYECIEIRRFDDIGAHRSSYLGFPIDENDRERIGHVEDVLKLIYMLNGKEYGNESHIITNSRFGDLFDIVYEDTPDDALAKYEYLIDTTPDSSISKRLGDRFRVLESKDIYSLEARLHALEKEILPLTADKLCWLLSTDEKGKRYFSVFNNEGNHRSLKQGDVIDRNADEVVTVTLREVGELSVIKASSEEIKVTRLDDKTYSVYLPATEFAVFGY